MRKGQGEYRLPRERGDEAVGGVVLLVSVAPGFVQAESEGGERGGDVSGGEELGDAGDPVVMEKGVDLLPASGG